MKNIVTKICTKCEKEKGLAEFPKDKRVKSGRRADCKTCTSIYKSNYWKKNKESIRKYHRRYYKNNIEKKKEQAKSWYENNKEKHRESCKKYIKNNIERARASARKGTKKWLATNPEYKLSWREKNRDKWNEYNRTRRAKKYGSNGRITAKEKIALFEKYGNKCLCCGRKDIKLELDHIIPIKLGGMNVIENAQPLCKSCNCKKHLKTTDYRK